jgi:hypothetical protein
LKSEFGDQIIDEVKRYLLAERDRDVKKILGIGHREIGKQLITDLYSLPGSGGSDERMMARDWFFREVGLIGRRGDFKTWGEMHSILESFHMPGAQEVEAMAAKLSLGRSR